jgi:hypothetical protein
MVKLAEKRVKEEQAVRLERPIYERIWERQVASQWKPLWGISGRPSYVGLGVLQVRGGSEKGG